MMATALDHRYWRLWAATALSNLGDGIRAAALQLVTCGGQFDTATGHYRSNIIVFATMRP
jgi:hypothetical protein